MTATLDLSSAVMPPSAPVSSDRVLAGRPETSTLAIHHDGVTEFGLWTVTPGEFTTARSGQREFIHVIDGVGELVSDDELVTSLSPGTLVVLEDGWSGRWVIRETLTKSYVLTASGRREEQVGA